MSVPILEALRKADSALERVYDEMDPVLMPEADQVVRGQVREAMEAVADALPIAQGMFGDPWANWPSQRSLQLSRVISELTYAMGKYPRDTEAMGIAMAKAVGALSRITLEPVS